MQVDHEKKNGKEEVLLERFNNGTILDQESAITGVDSKDSLKLAEAKRIQNILRGRIHALSTRYNCSHAQTREDAAQACAG